MVARLKKTTGRLRTALAHGRAVKKTTGRLRTASAHGCVVKKQQLVNLEPPWPMAARLTKGNNDQSKSFKAKINSILNIYSDMI